MYLHPYTAQQLAKERQREMLAQAAEQRQARQLTMAARRAKRAGRRMRQAVLNALPLHAGPR